MNQFDWKRFLKRESQKVIADYEIAEYWAYPEFPEEALESEWLGFPGASEEEIAGAEARLGISLPPSYRDFLKVTNGWIGYLGILPLRPVRAVEWFHIGNQDWIDAYTVELLPTSDEEYFVYGKNVAQPNRLEYLQTALQISDDQDGAVILLNPKVVFDKEWEAWFFANYIPGAKRYRSFIELFRAITMS